jgi:predicted trehalose synthase
MHILDSGPPGQLVELRGQAFLDKGSLSGNGTAEFHRALIEGADDPTFKPEPSEQLYQIALSQSMTSFANRVLRLAAKFTPSDAPSEEALREVLSHQDLIMDRFGALRLGRIDAMSGTVTLPSDNEPLAIPFDAYLMQKKVLFELPYELNDSTAWAIIPLEGISDSPGLPLAESAEIRNREGGDLPSGIPEESATADPASEGGR